MKKGDLREMTRSELQAAIEAAREKYFYDYDYIAVRTQYEPFELGPIDHRSRVWVNDCETDEELNGICATDIKSKAVYMHCSGIYSGTHIAIIGGNCAEYGQDDGELIIKDAVALEILS